MSDSDDALAYIFGTLGEDEAWQRALDRAAQPEQTPAYAKTDEDRALDAETWALYTQQNRASQRDVGERAQAGKKALGNLRRLTREQRRGRQRFVCYCPHRPHGCRLVVAYAWTGPSASPIAGAETLLLVAHNGKGQRATFPNWPLESERLDPDQWLPIACPHGTGTFPNGVPGQMIHAVFTASSGHRIRRITDLIGASSATWTPAAPCCR